MHRGKRSFSAVHIFCEEVARNGGRSQDAGVLPVEDEEAATTAVTTMGRWEFGNVKTYIHCPTVHKVPQGPMKSLMVT